MSRVCLKSTALVYCTDSGKNFVANDKCISDKYDPFKCILQNMFQLKASQQCKFKHCREHKMSQHISKRNLCYLGCTILLLIVAIFSVAN